MSVFIAAPGTLVLKRLAYHWPTLATAAVGVLLAAMIGAGVPLYTAAVGEIGLQQALATAPVPEGHVSLRTAVYEATASDYLALDENLRTAIKLDLGRWLSQIVAWGETTPLLPQRDGEAVAGTRLRLAFYQAWSQHATILEGTLPRDPPADGVHVEGAISPELARAVGLKVGDRLTLTEARASSHPIELRISGIVRAEDPDDPFWYADDSPLVLDPPLREWRIQGSVLVDPVAFFRVLENHLPETRTTFGWRALLDHRRIRVADISEVQLGLLRLPIRLARSEAVPRTTIDSGLDALLSDYLHRSRLLRAPFGLLLAEIGVLVAYYLLVTAALVRRSERRELAQLRSRGADSVQIWLLRGLEALLICGLAALLGPLLARTLLSLLGLWGPFRELTGGPIPLTLTGETFAYGSAAALVAWLAFMLPLGPALRRPLVGTQSPWARPAQVSGWQRYGLDWGLLLASVVAFWQMRRYGALLARRASDSALFIDPLLLLTPTLLLLAVALLLLRGFPLLMKAVASLGSARPGLLGTLATWQVSRHPVHYGRLTLLLALAVGLGWFATAFNATAERSRTDRAAYQVGADRRLVEQDSDFHVGRVRPMEAYTRLPGVAAASPVYRTFIQTTPRLGRSTPAMLLGIDPATFPTVARWREDLDPRPLSELVALLAAEEAVEPPGWELPDTPTRIGMWLRWEPDADPQPLLAYLKPAVKVLDAEGTLANVRLRPQIVERVIARREVESAGLDGDPRPYTGWVYLEGNLDDVPRALHPPLRLMAVHWTYRLPALSFGLPPSSFDLTDLTIIDGQGRRMRLGWMEERREWESLHDGGSPVNLSVTYQVSSGRHRRAGVHVDFRQDGKTSAMGVIFNSPAPGTLPALVSRSFVKANALSGQRPFTVNTGGVKLTFELVGQVDYFPTLYANETPFIVTDLNRLMAALNRRPSATVYPQEAWLRLASGRDGVARATGREPDGYTTTRTWDLMAIRRKLQNDPLTVGLTGLFFMAFAVALLLSGLSLVSYAALTAQARRIEFGVLRALGLSARGLLASLAVEQALVVGSGFLGGSLLGAELSRLILPFLAVTERGRKVVPPFWVRTETAALAGYGLGLALILALLLGSTLFLLRRLAVARTLQLGEE